MPINKFKYKNILSVNTAHKIAGVIVILFALLHCEADYSSVFAQTPDKSPNRTTDETTISSEAEYGDAVPYSKDSAHVEPVTKTRESNDGFGNRIDRIHDRIYETAQSQVERVDAWFRSPSSDQGTAGKSRFRVGLYGEGKIQEYKDTDVKPVLDLDTEIELPNLMHRVKLIVTTSDPARQPGRSLMEQIDKSLRTFLVRDWVPGISTAFGVRLRWTPELFAYGTWSHDWKAGDWHLYHQQKIYWESRTSYGHISSLVLDHWINRWNTRISTSLKWSKQDRDEDQNTGRNDKGFRWSEVVLFSYARELLDESQLGRIISGDDIARGWGLRLSAFGGFHFADEFRAGIFYRWQLRKKWMYSYAGPEIKWINENTWKQEWMIKWGIEMLFWGENDR